MYFFIANLHKNFLQYIKEIFGIRRTIFIEVIIVGEITYTFKEICGITGYRASVIRYYEKEFELNIPRDINGRRIFSKKELENLLFIKGMQKEGYTNKQIKKMLKDGVLNNAQESAASCEGNLSSNIKGNSEDEIVKLIDEKFRIIDEKISELNNNVGSKDRDLLISENLKLRMEIKQKSYEIIELKEKLRYERERDKGIFKGIFKKSK